MNYTLHAPCKVVFFYHILKCGVNHWTVNAVHRQMSYGIRSLDPVYLVTDLLP